MWVIKETEDELTIKSFPLILWAIVLIIFILAGIIANGYLKTYGGFSKIGKLFEGKIFDILINVFAFSFTPIAGLVVFYFSPLIITKFNRQKHIITKKTYSIFGKQTRKFGYNHLDGGVRVKLEESEDSNYYSLYFKTKSNEKIKLSNEFSMWKGRNYDVAMKANEYLRSKTV